MSESRIERIREILDLAMERPSADREAFVAGASGGDAATHAEVMSLLGALSSSPDALEPPETVPHAPSEPLTGLAFGPYIVAERIGEGGMGVVYAARDTRLGRMVAVKSLPSTVARDTHRRARLEQEARSLAAVNHPNIATIHGVEDTPRGPVLVLEFVPGRTLAQELAERLLSIDEAVAIAIQIARGLESAHAAGIIHRDLKPANIKVTPEGIAKVLDFGVAKPAPRIATSATEPGMIVGSAAYMSPEQARGRPVDRRADIWAFGCVLYEMITGKRVFDAPTTSEILAAVLTREVDWSALPANIPSNVRRLLSRCLEKDPDLRLRDAGDAALELRSPAEPPPAPTPARRTMHVPALASLAAIIGLAAIVARPWSTTPSPSPPRVALTIDAPGLGAASGTLGCMALSPDGQTLVYCARESESSSVLYSRRLDSFDAAPIEHTEGGQEPFFSPDGRSIGFGLQRASGVMEVRRAPLSGGPAEKITSAPLTAASWADDGTIVASVAPGHLKQFAALGPDARLRDVVAPVPGELHIQPEVLPGSRSVLFTSLSMEGTRFRARIEVADIATGERRVLIEDATTPKFVRDRNLLCYRSATSLLAVALDPRSVRVTGDPRRIVDSVGGEPRGSTRMSVSASGTIAFISGAEPAENTDLGWYHTDGTIRTILKGDTRIWTLRLSPDGSRVAYTLDADLEHSLWVCDLTRGSTTKLFTPGKPIFPVWTPDGTRIAFESATPEGKDAILWTAADGSGTPETIFAAPGDRTAVPNGFSPDGRLMLVMINSGSGDETDLHIVDMAAGRTSRPLFPTSAYRSAARFSPDGRFIAYTSRETGRPEIYVQPFPALDAKVQVSIDGGERPTWSGDGKHLFWRLDNTIFSADVRTDPALAAGLPRTLLKDLPGMRYDTAPEGDRFIMSRPRIHEPSQRKINLIVNALGPNPENGAK